jgi:hypothetical protein
MRKALLAILVAAGVAAVIPQAASAADGCGPRRHWNGWRCVWNGPRFYGPAVGFYAGPRWHRWHGWHGGDHWRRW